MNFALKNIMKGLRFAILSIILNSVSCASLLARSGLSKSFIPRANYPLKRSFSSHKSNEPKFGKAKALCSFVAVACMSNAFPEHENESIKVDGSSSTELENRGIRAHIGVFCIPKTEAEPSENRICNYCSCGEDSFGFNASKDKIYLGIADGVGGFAELGGDPALFAQTLMKNALEASNEHHFDEDQVCRNIINEAYNELLKDFRSKEVVPMGGSTACIALINTNDGKIKFANVGDSGLMILRPTSDEKKDYKIIFQTKALQYRFNCPYQLAFSPKHGEFNPTNESDTEESFEATKSFCLRSDDIVLLATDGVLDNLFPSDIEEIVNTVDFSTESTDNVSNLISKKISFKAREYSLDRNRNSPFAVAELEQTGKARLGGKRDDIATVAALIKDI